MTNVIENERWRDADRAADLLSVDRDVCRRAFHHEPEERIYEVVLWILAQRNLSGQDRELMIENVGPASKAPVSTLRTADKVTWSTSRRP